MHAFDAAYLYPSGHCSVGPPPTKSDNQQQQAGAPPPSGAAPPRAPAPPGAPLGRMPIPPPGMPMPPSQGPPGGFPPPPPGWRGPPPPPGAMMPPFGELLHSLLSFDNCKLHVLSVLLYCYGNGAETVWMRRTLVFSS